MRYKRQRAKEFSRPHSRQRNPTTRSRASAIQTISLSCQRISISLQQSTSANSTDKPTP